MSDADHRSTQPAEPLQPLEPAQVAGFAERVLDEVARAVVGKREVLSLVLAGILAKGHVLLEDFPGLGKTLAARSFAGALGLEFSRAQFTPDLLPADLTGSYVYDQRRAEFDFRPGPVFAGLLLADEINRTPPKTQAALLEAMQEGQVTVEGKTHPLPEPVPRPGHRQPGRVRGHLPAARGAARPLPAARRVRVPHRRRGVRRPAPPPRPAARGGRHRPGHRRRRAWPPRRPRSSGWSVDESVARYCVDLAAATRSHPDVLTGASPRGSLGLVLTARAWAAIRGRDFVVPEDVKVVARAVLAHRITVKPDLWMTEASGSRVVDSVLASVETPRTLEAHRSGRP